MSPQSRRSIWDHPFVLALVAGIFVVLAAFLPKWMDEPSKQAWLIIKKVRLYHDSENEYPVDDGSGMGRLIIKVNGQLYSYPSLTIYQSFGGDDLPEEAFPLNTDSAPGKLTVAFEMLSPHMAFLPQESSENGAKAEEIYSFTVSRAVSTQKDIINAIPFKGQYHLNHVSPYSRRSHYRYATVEYEVRYDP
jgi:hypothetical protein